jgi:hypothetical protein
MGLAQKYRGLLNGTYSINDMTTQIKKTD